MHTIFSASNPSEMMKEAVLDAYDVRYRLRWRVCGIHP